MRFIRSLCFKQIVTREVRRGRLIVGFFSLAVVAGCTPRNAYQAPPPTSVTVATPERRDVTDYFEQTGQLAAVNTVTLMARVEGYLTGISYKDGETVEKGRTLFTIEQAPFKASLDQAEANLAAAKAKATFASQQYDRFITLAKEQYAPEMQAQQYTADRDSTAASVAQMTAALEQARITYSYTTVTAPFTGRVSAHQQDIGALVGTSQTAQLATLTETNPIWVNFNLNEADAVRARASRTAKGAAAGDIRDIPVEIAMQTESGYPHAGHIDYAAPAIDPSTGTLAVRATFDNGANTLLPGAFVRLRIPVRTLKNALLVPDTALGNQQGEPILLVVDADNVVQQRNVSLGPKQGSFQVIEKGLDPQDRVIVEGVQRVAAGETVAPREAPPPGAPATGKQP